ncbi:MAG: DUF1643 domain-containing protein [Oscillospiraceae bacterium]|nr:DUF1643 domain-containing protein [Oscillospiraceae bacterium]MBQ9664050.1 DUF1643 domain-containing protein [Oscillospiraceae bacterium]
MHIPQSDTSCLEILSYREACEKSTSDSYDRERWLYVPDFYTEYRYVLGTKGEHPVICVGINPSTAEPDNLDPTLKSVSRIADTNGYDSWLMFNVYAQRATRPDDMDPVRNEQLHRENMEAFRALLERAASCGGRPVVWAAWGAIIEKRAWLTDCVRDMRKAAEEYGADWVCAGNCSKRGHPHHPLYLRKDERFHPFDIGGYLA